MTIYTILPDSLTPALPNASDPQPIILATKFRVDQSGWITHLRFWKHYQNLPSGNGWSNRPMYLFQRVNDNPGNNVVIASVASTAAMETTEGWQNIPLPTPVAVGPGDIYTVSSLMPSAVYSATGGFFLSDYRNGNSPVWAPSSDNAAGNGGYQYINPGENTNVYPSNSFNAGNYFVDVVFTDTNPVVPRVTFNARESGIWTSHTATPKVWTGSGWTQATPKRWDTDTSSWINLS